MDAGVAGGCELYCKLSITNILVQIFFVKKFISLKYVFSKLNILLGTGPRE